MLDEGLGHALSERVGVVDRARPAIRASAIAAQATLEEDQGAAEGLMADAVMSVHGDERYWQGLQLLGEVWEEGDSQQVADNLVEYESEFLEGEAIALRAAGVTDRAQTLVLGATIQSGAPVASPPPVDAARQRCRQIEESLRELRAVDRYEEERTERRFTQRLRLFTRAIQVVSGAALMLSDVAGVAGSAVVQPWLVVPSGALAWVSIGKGNHLLREGSKPASQTEGIRGTLERLKAAGHDDPDIDFWLAMLANDKDGMARALDNGANVDGTVEEIVQRYAPS